MFETPIEGPPVEWRGAAEGTTTATRVAVETTTPEEVPTVRDEIIVGANNLKPAAFLEYGVYVSRAVARIVLPGRGVATGFLVDTDVLLTNNHVFEEAAHAQDATVQFNYQYDLTGNLMPAKEYRCDPESFFHTNAALDYSLVRVLGEPGAEWGALTLRGNLTVVPETDIMIVQHPSGNPKMVGIVDNMVVYVEGAIMQYLTDTMPGSSGSPVFNENWQVVGLHHSGGWFPQPTQYSTHYRNEGILVSSIVADMPNWRTS